MAGPDSTHAPERRSWLDADGAPPDGSSVDFPIQNLPYGVFSVAGGGARIGVAIRDRILDLTALEAGGHLRPGGASDVFASGVLNPFMALPKAVWTRTRAAISALLDEDGGMRDLPLVPRAEADMHLPFFVRSFTDFYASREHATNVGRMFRDPDRALMPNWLHMPVGYNGRASTVVVSGTPIRRPCGQLRDAGDLAPRFGPTRKLDMEIELGAIVGTPSPMGARLSTAGADASIFGYVLLNDWSARDIQVWEYQPLGPFQSKAFATTISPWVVTTDALVPFRAPTPPREVPLLPHLHEDADNNLDIRLTARLTPEGGRPEVIARTRSDGLYYSPAQQLAHHSACGCAMETGDLLGSGTISGADPGSFGSLLELTRDGAVPLRLRPGGRDRDAGLTRTYIEDGDTITLTGHCEGAYRIGFGDCAGRIEPAEPA